MNVGLNVGTDSVFGNSKKKNDGKDRKTEFAPQELLTDEIMNKANLDSKDRVMKSTAEDGTKDPKLQADYDHYQENPTTESFHESGGNCAEQGSTNAYAKSHPGTTMTENNGIPDKKSASFAKTGASTEDNPAPTCSSRANQPGEIGCDEFLKASGTQDCEPTLRTRYSNLRRAPACAYDTKRPADKNAPTKETSSKEAHAKEPKAKETASGKTLKEAGKSCIHREGSRREKAYQISRRHQNKAI